MARKSNMPTRKDVADLAGVSETIVSYVLNANRYVSADKKKRVLEAVEKLHYRPNSIARALKGKGNSHILFIADNVANNYFGRLLQELDGVAYDKGYLVSLMSAKSDRDFVSRILSRHLGVDSPYNTYLYPGLPPGPISCPPKNCLEAVLNAERHDFLFFCADPSFNGSHRFAASYSDHLANARAFQRALTARQQAK